MSYLAGQVVLPQKFELLDGDVGSSESKWSMTGDLDTCAVRFEADALNDPLRLVRPPQCLIHDVGQSKLETEFEFTFKSITFEGFDGVA